MRNKICGVYCIKNLINNKKYIGVSSNIIKRWKYHKSFLKIGKHDNVYLQNSWNKHGKENFVFIVLEECKREDLYKREVYYIKKLKTKDRNLGYNLSDGGKSNFGWIPADETIVKKSEAVRGNKNPMFRKKHSDKTKKLFSKQRIGNKNGVGNKNNLGKIKRYLSSTSKFFGVRKNVGKRITWTARFSENGKEITLGTFKKEKLAAKEFDKKSWEVYRDLNKLNFPNDYK